MIDSNLILLNEYLQENKQRIQVVDNARITRIQKQAKDFDPLTDSEPNTEAVLTTTVYRNKNLKLKHYRHEWL
jgi:hypothetical protein